MESVESVEFHAQTILELVVPDYPKTRENFDLPIRGVQFVTLEGICVTSDYN